MRPSSYCDVISGHYDVNIINADTAHKSLTSTKTEPSLFIYVSNPEKNFLLISFSYFGTDYKLKFYLNSNPFCTLDIRAANFKLSKY